MPGWLFRPATVLLAACLAAPALAFGPPQSRLEAALDLSTPEAAAITYSEVFADNDFIAAYFVLDPMARERFAMAVARLQLDYFMAADADLDDKLAAFDGDGHLGPYEHATRQDSPIQSNDVFHLFQVALWGADQYRIHAIDFAGPVTVDKAGQPFDDDGHARAIVYAEDSHEGRIRFLLQASPAGRWRVLAITARPGAVDEVEFLPMEEGG